MAQIHYNKNCFQHVTLTFNSADELAYITEILLQPSEHLFRKRNLKTFDADVDMELYGMLAGACLDQKINYEHHEEEHSLPIILDVDYENHRYDQPEDRPTREQNLEPADTYRIGNELHSDCTDCTQKASFSQS